MAHSRKKPKNSLDKSRDLRIVTVMTKRFLDIKTDHTLRFRMALHMQEGVDRRVKRLFRVPLAEKLFEFKIP